MLATFLAQLLMLRAPLTQLKEKQPELFHQIDGGHALNSGWFTLKFTRFLLAGNFGDSVQDASTASKFTSVCRVSRIGYGLLLLCFFAGVVSAIAA